LPLLKFQPSYIAISEPPADGTSYNNFATLRVNLR